MVRELLPFKAPNGQDSVCRVELLMLGDGRHVVICEELDENPGMSVSSAWESVVDAVCRRHGVPLEGTVWIEHNDEELRTAAGTLGRWQLVNFARPAQGQRRGRAEWRNMTADDWHELGLPPRE